MQVPRCYCLQSPSMKFTCLSKGKGFYFPPCHIVDVCGFRILLDCPIDLSALTIFSPFPTDYYMTLDRETFSSPEALLLNMESAAQKGQNIENPLDAKSLIKSEPWYKIDYNLLLWDVSSVDIVLISSPMGMLGLPFLSRMKDFSAKIYATEATAKLGQLMMEDLILLHLESRQIYGTEESEFPKWLNWKELEMLPSTLREIAVGNDGKDLGGWMPLYSAVDVKDCLKKIHTLKYAEEACYNGTLIVKAFSSGLEIGACNWTINGPKRTIACLSDSVFRSAHVSDFDYCALQGCDLILFSPLNIFEDDDAQNDYVDSTSNDWPKFSGDDNVDECTKSLLCTDESLEEVEKLAFICSCAVDCVKSGGSVLIPIGRVGIVLQLLEQISLSLESLKVPIYIISSMAENLLAFTNIIPEWLCKERQEKLFSGEPLFAHVELLKEKKVHVFPAVYSPELLTIWQEPCIVFSPHWSLRLGPVVHLLRRWAGDSNSLLVMEEGVDTDVALLPFKPMAMKVLQCSFRSGIKRHKVQPLLNILQPKVVLFPKDFKQWNASSNRQLFSSIYYSENETLRIPSLKDSSEIEIAVELASQFRFRRLKQENINVVRLRGELLMDRGKHRLLSGKEQLGPSHIRPLLNWGLLDAKRLLEELQNLGVNGTVKEEISEAKSGNHFTLHISDPHKALIEVHDKSTVVSAGNEDFVSLIFQAIDKSLDGV